MVDFTMTGDSGSDMATSVAPQQPPTTIPVPNREVTIPPAFDIPIRQPPELQPIPPMPIMPPPADLGPIQEDIRRRRELAEQAARDAIAGIDTGAGALSKARAAADELFRSQQLLNQLDKARAERVQAAQAEVAQAIGIDPRQISNFTVRTASEVGQLNTQLQAVEAAYNKTNSISFFDDPGQYLINHLFVLPKQTKEYNAVATALNQRLDIMDRVTTLTDEATKQILFANQQDASQRAVALDLAAKGTQDRLLAEDMFKAANANNNALSVRNAITQSQFELAVRYQDSVSAASRTSLEYFGQQLHLRDQVERDNNMTVQQVKETNDILNQARQAEIQKVQIERELMVTGDLKQKALAIDDQQRRINNAALAYGINAISVDELRQLPNGPLKMMWENALVDPNIQTNRNLGGDVLRSLQAYSQLPRSVVTNLQWTADHLNQIAIAAETELSLKPEFRDAKDPDIRHAMLVSNMQARLNIMMQDINTKDNIFAPQPLQVIANIPAMKNSPLIAALMPVLEKNSNYIASDQDYLQAAIKAVNDKTMTQDQAVAELVRVHQAIMGSTNDRNQLQRFSVGALNNTGTGYRSTVQTGSAYFGGSQKVNWLNQSEVQAAFIKALRQNASDIIFTQSVGAPGL